MPDDPRGEGERIAQLMEEVRGMAGPSTWARVEELMRRILRLHGDGLDRLLALVAGPGQPGAEELAERLSRDELVSSLLLLHGLHPVPAPQRLARAVEELRGRLGEIEVELLGVDEAGVVRLRVEAGADRRCGFSGNALRRALEQALLEAAPEVARVEVEGLEPAAPRERLVTLGRPGVGRGMAG